MAASPATLAPLYLAIEKGGVALLAAHKAQIEAALDPVLTNDADQIVSALASHITMHGLAGTMEAPLRNAIVETEPTIDGVIIGNVATALDGLQAIFAGLVASGHAPPN